MNDTQTRCFKIMEPAENGGVQTLFHGVNRSRVLPFNTWIEAERKWSGEGGTKYWTGFHVMTDYEKSKKYMNRFTDKKKTRILVRCIAKGLRPKKSSRGRVFLADYLYIPNKFDDNLWLQQ